MVDIDKLREAIRVMTRRSKIYKVLKEELSSLGYWKNKRRGNPRAGYECMLTKGK